MVTRRQLRLGLGHAKRNATHSRRTRARWLRDRRREADRALDATCWRIPQVHGAAYGVSACRRASHKGCALSTAQLSAASIAAHFEDELIDDRMPNVGSL